MTGSATRQTEMLRGFKALYNYYGSLAPGKFCQEFTDVFLFSVYFILRATLKC